MFMNRFLRIYCCCVFLFLAFAGPLFAAVGKLPITVNGDVVEFSSSGREVVAEGSVEIDYQDSKMTCDKVRVFIDEKLAIAEGHVFFYKSEAEEFSGDLVIFDFGSRTGTITGPQVDMAPYYGSAEIMDRMSDEEFYLYNAEMSTCDLPHPHWGLKCREVKMTPGRVLTAKDIRLNVLNIPLLYVPVYTQVMTDKRPRLMIMPGFKKEFGKELFGSWRYYLNDSARGILHVDWYEKTGWAQGVDLNYDTHLIGRGNAKYYRVDGKDRRKEKNLDAGEILRSGERSRIELRHKWNISEDDSLIAEYYRQSDIDFRKDYFLREYTKEPNLRTFLQYSHVYPNATLSFLAEPRVNSFYSVTEKVPELKLETINQRIGESPFYFKDVTSSTYFMSAPANSAPTTQAGRMDTLNQLSYLFRFMGVDLSPYVGHEDTFYSRGVNGKERLIRGMFFTGIDASLKLYKVFDIDTNFLNLEINKLRHVITPSCKYRYQHPPTVNKSKIQQFDSIDALDRQNSIELSLENKLQTKRSGQSVDLTSLIVSTTYAFEDNSTVSAGFGNVTTKWEMNPYSWCGFQSDASFSQKRYYLMTVSNSLWMNIGRFKTNFGYEYKREETSQLTVDVRCKLNPFWSLGVYDRFEFKTGDLVEQEYTLERDMHCWVAQLIVNKRETEGITVLLAFKLKAFPEMAVGAQKSFVAPKATEE